LFALADRCWRKRPQSGLAPSSKHYTGCPRVAKKPHNLIVIKDINFFFFLDDSYASTAYSENIAIYTGVPKKEDESITPLFIGRF
jgi:hypothetical protein